MKQLLIFILLIALSLGIDLKPVNLDDLRGDSIRVTVSGAVQKPGLLTLPLYSSVQDALDRALPAPDADLDGLNPQTILKDRDVLHVPERQEAALISINTAGSDDLQKLPGIGASTAARIIAYRSENGLFQQLEDLMNVKGIGRTKFNALKDRICL